MTDPNKETIEFQALMDNLNLGIFRQTVKGGDRFAFVNTTFQRMSGLSGEEILKMSPADVFEDKKKYRLLIEKTCQLGSITHEEAELKTRDKRKVLCSLSMVAVRDAQGKVEYIDGVVQDVSGQKQAENELKESKELFQVVFNNSTAAIIVTDKEERIVTWNPFAERMLEMDKKELFNKPFKNLYPSQEWRRMRLSRVKEKGILSDIETQVCKKDGSALDVNLSLAVIKDTDGNIVGSIATLQDITKQKNVQRMLLQAKNAAEEVSQAKSLFLANMSHEVRTPMNTIMGMVDLTLDTPLNEEQKENLTTVKEAADVLLNLLNDILDLSRVEAGKIQLEAIEVNVPNLVKSVCKGLSVLARNKKVELEWDIDSQVPELIQGDPIRIRQVLVNLINNAIKFTFKGKIVVAIKVLSKDEESCELQFSVADEGVGIAKNKLEIIFEAFTQADASTTRRFGGTGLGLAISKKLVEMMHGRIWVQSEEFKGSTFYFSGKYKVVKKEDVPQALKEKSIEAELLAQLPKRSLKHLSILLAEDNIVNQKIAVRILETKEWMVKTADNGQQVLDYLQKGTFDVILMDAQMPILDGFETTKIIRENEKKTGEHIPIVALTARAMAGDEKKCKDCGMDGYVSKPIDRQKLYEAVERFF
jgi:PAS domain S-box-containing protein